MKYVAIDLETSGLNPETDQVLEMAAVVDDLTSPLESLPRFRAYVRHNTYHGSAAALYMNREILKILSLPDSLDVVDAEAVMWKFYNFLTGPGGIPVIDPTLPLKVVAAGKNFASFDQKFISKLPNGHYVKFHHRVMDPTMLYFEKSDVVPPDSKLCMERAGLPGEVEHTALADALMVVKLIRKKLC